MDIKQTSLRCIDNIYFKCEFENPTGSVKDRSISYQVSKLSQQGIQKAVISSSGNAAISAAIYCKKENIVLTVFVSPHICLAKLDVLKKLYCTIIISKKPISDAARFEKNQNAYNMRQSKDDLAVPGYETIAYELYNQLPTVDAVFVPVSSGTTLVGIARGFQKIGKMPALHTVQTESVHPIAQKFDNDFQKKVTSIADGIVARFTPREDEIISWIKKSKGSGWVISDEKMQDAHKILSKHNLLCSYEGAAAMAALGKAKNKGFIYKNPVCILTGKYYECG